MIRNIIKIPIIFLLKVVDLYSLYSLRTYGHLKDAGWFKSFKTSMSIDNDRNPIPWYTYPAIYFIESRIDNHMTVFEYGCGNSTLWWAHRVKKVISCEDNYAWYERIKREIPANVELYQIDSSNENQYVEKIKEYQNEFDIIIIDGWDRVNCVKNCLPALKKDGVIIWDNSDRAIYEEGYHYLLDNGYRRVDFKVSRL